MSDEHDVTNLEAERWARYILTRHPLAEIPLGLKVGWAPIYQHLYDARFQVGLFVHQALICYARETEPGALELLDKRQRGVANYMRAATSILRRRE